MDKSNESSGSQSHGPATDSNNSPVIDPTENVTKLVEAAVSRLDDLRRVSNEHTTVMANLRADHDRELRISEAERINAIRAVDVAASQQATKDAEVRATALAAQVAATAEAQRNQVAAAAAAQATALTQALVPIQTSIAELTQRMYEQQGQKAQVSESRGEQSDSRQNYNLVLGIIGAVIAIIVLSMSVYAGLRATATNPSTSEPKVVTVTTP